MKQSLKTFGILAATAIALPSQALAQSPFERGAALVNGIGVNATGGSPQPLERILGNIINAVLGFLGIVFLILLLYAGFLWMTAQGEEKQVTKAKDIIKQAVIGLIVIVAAFAISNFVLSSLVNVTR